MSGNMLILPLAYLELISYSNYHEKSQRALRKNSNFRKLDKKTKFKAKKPKSSHLSDFYSYLAINQQSLTSMCNLTQVSTARRRDQHESSDSEEKRYRTTNHDDP